jgi:hypothetical protein
LSIRFFTFSVFSLSSLPALVLTFGRRTFTFVVFFAASGLTFSGTFFFLWVGFLAHGPDLDENHSPGSRCYTSCASEAVSMTGRVSR